MQGSPGCTPPLELLRALEAHSTFALRGDGARDPRGLRRGRVVARTGTLQAHTDEPIDRLRCIFEGEIQVPRRVANWMWPSRYELVVVDRVQRELHSNHALTMESANPNSVGRLRFSLLCPKQIYLYGVLTVLYTGPCLADCSRRTAGAHFSS